MCLLGELLLDPLLSAALPSPLNAVVTRGALERQSRQHDLAEAPH